MDLVLKQFDDILLHFTAKRTIDGIDVAITSTNKDKATYLPLGMKSTNESLTRWLRHRTIPANRAYAQNFLSKNGLSENDFIGILQICKGLSLTDCYWVTYPDDPKTFAQVNLFDNRFSQVLSQIAFTGYGSSPASKFRSSPEFTTNGMLPKAWRRKDGKVLLYKGGTSGFANTGKEPYSEFYAAQEAEVQQRKLDAEVRKQADADLYRRQKEAEAKKYEAERAAEAQKFSKQQEAEGIELVGKAEAEAIRQKGLAEAEAMKQKAEAYKQYNDAAVAEMLIKVLPDIAKSVAQPLSSIDKVSIIGGDASGVSGVSGNVPILMAQTMQTVKEATGIDMGEIVRANSIQAKTDRNINIMTQCEQPENNKEKGGAKAMERVEGGYLIHEKSLNGEKVTHFRPDVTEEEKAIMKGKKAKD